MAIIGIDLGTTNSLACVWQENRPVLIPNAFGEYMTPSVVGFSDTGEVLVGKVARERLLTHPHLTCAAFKRFMGSKKTMKMGEKMFLPEELSSFVLRKLKADAERYLGEEVTEAIISVPAYFNDNQRNATKNAAKLAGIIVERLVNEPSAAALASRLERIEMEENYLVFDFGGGTLDVSVVDCFENIIEIVAVAGDNRLGGNDFDWKMIEYFCKEHALKWEELLAEEKAAIYNSAEICKRELSSQNESTLRLKRNGVVLECKINRETLVLITEALLARINKTISRALKDSRRTIEDIDRILLAGGSSRMPIIQSYLKYLLKKEAVIIENPDTVVAEGAGVCAGMKSRDAAIRDIMMTDVCPFTLGTAVMADNRNERPVMFPMIERNSILPFSVEHRFFTVQHGQKHIDVTIYQGEEYLAEENILLGKIRFPVPPAMGGKESVLVRFTYDINGILEVEVYHEATRKRKRELILGEGNTLTEVEIEKRLLELKSLKIHPAEQEKNQYLLAKGMRLYKETTGEIREEIGSALDYFQNALCRRSQTELKHAASNFRKLLDYHEKQLQSMNYPDISKADFDEFRKHLKEI